MIIVDDHLALLRITGALPEFDEYGPVATTSSFQFRLARAVADSAHSGRLSRTLSHPNAALRRILSPPGNRLIVLDPRASMEEAAGIAVRYRANLLLAQFAGAALKHDAAVRVTPGTLGRSWEAVMDAEHVDFATFEA